LNISVKQYNTDVLLPEGMRNMSCLEDCISPLDEAKSKLKKHIQNIGNIEFMHGLRTGWMQMGREMLMDALEERFGKVPESTSNEIDKIGSKYSLRTLLLYVFRSKSIEEFQQVLEDF